MARNATIFDTRHDGERSDSTAEARLFGDDMLALETFDGQGGRWLTLAGPDGQVCHPEHIWANIFASMFHSPAMKRVAA